MVPLWLRYLLQEDLEVDRSLKTEVVLSQPNGCQQVVLESVRAPVNLRTPPEWGYKVLDHIEERLYQVEGRLRVEPDASRASRITMTAPTEGTAEAWREAAD